MPKVPLPLNGKVALRQLIATGLDQARGKLFLEVLVIIL